MAFAAQGGQEPTSSAPKPTVLTSAPSSPDLSTPSSPAGGDERSARPSRSAKSPRKDLVDKPKKPKAEPSPTETAEPEPEPTTPTPDPSPTPVRTRTSEPEPAPQPSSTGGGILGGTNAARANAGLPALSVDSCLAGMAQRHAERLAAANTLYHQNLSAVMSSCGVSAAGENVAMNFTGSSAMVEQWMNSAGHRANLLSSQFTVIGIGVAQARDGSWYGVQVFGAK